MRTRRLVRVLRRLLPRLPEDAQVVDGERRHHRARTHRTTVGQCLGHGDRLGARQVDERHTEEERRQDDKTKESAHDRSPCSWCGMPRTPPSGHGTRTPCTELCILARRRRRGPASTAEGRQGCLTPTPLTTPRRLRFRASRPWASDPSLRLRDRPVRFPPPAALTVASVTSRPNGEPLVRLSGVNKWFGELHVLQDIDLTWTAARSSSSSAPPARASRRCAAPSTGSRPSSRATIPIDGAAAARGGQAARPAARRRRHGLPELQPLRAQDGPRERHARADQGPREVEGRRREARPASCSTGSASPRRPTSTPRSSPAASSSASRSPGRWRWTRR